MFWKFGTWTKTTRSRHRLVLMSALKYLAPAIALVFLMFYSYSNYSAYYPSLSTFASNETALDGVRAENCGNVESLDSEGFIISGGQEKIKVKYIGARQPVFGSACVLGTYNKQGHINAETVRYNDYIFLKYIISGFALLYVVYIFAKEWKLTKRGFEPNA